MITGGTGKTGSRVVERLQKRGVSVRIGSRGNEPAFDWENSGTWTKALADMDGVYITFQPDLAVPGARETVEAFTAQAVKQGIQKIVLLSGRGEKEAERCEQVVMDAGADWTIVRASWFNQNFSEGFFLDSILAGHVALPRQEALVPYVDTDDVADVVVESFLDHRHSGHTYELTGPDQLTFRQITQAISKGTGRNIRFTSISMDDYTKMLRQDQVPEDYIWLIKYLFTEVLTEENSTVKNDVEKVLGRKAGDFNDYVQKTASTGIWNP